MKFAIFFYTFLALYVIGFSQKPLYEFTKIKKLESNRCVVYFELKSIENATQKSNIINALKTNLNIYSVNNLANNAIEIEINNNINADIVRDVILSFNADYDPIYLRKRVVDECENNPIINNNEYVQNDAQKYDEIKQKWILENPDEYQKIANPIKVKNESDEEKSDRISRENLKN